MKKIKYFITTLLFLSLLLAVVFYLSINNKTKEPVSPDLQTESIQEIDESTKQIKAPVETAPTAERTQSNTTTAAVSKPTESMSEKKNTLFDVPFTSQAPFAEWEDPIQQGGCEEAASLMAVKWVKGESLTKEEAKREIIAASNYEMQRIGEFHDTSAKDTAEIIIKGYFQHSNVRVQTVDSVIDIINELNNGNIVIVPVNGKALGNPNYTPPGPERHMLLIRGYNFSKKEFITNDAGTRKGEGYQYPEEVVFNALRDFLTGHNLPIEKIERNMIVVGR